MTFLSIRIFSLSRICAAYEEKEREKATLVYKALALYFVQLFFAHIFLNGAFLHPVLQHVRYSLEPALYAYKVIVLGKNREHREQTQFTIGFL